MEPTTNSSPEQDISMISDFRRDLNIENVLLGISLASNCLPPAFEDGTDTGFRNVGQLQFDAGEIPKRTFSRYIQFTPPHSISMLFLLQVNLKTAQW